MLTESINASVLEICERMNPITLDEMKDIRLMNRIDTKYLAPVALLPSLMLFVENDFRIQSVEGLRIGNYSTQYYDTDRLEMYLLHHNGKRPRQKVRARAYLDSGISFLEIKRKNNKGRTDKIRVQLPFDSVENLKLDQSVHGFLSKFTPYSESDLLPVLSSRFKRITLVNNNKSERITLDLNLHFHNYRNGNSSTLDNMMVIELKQDGKGHSKLKEFLFERRVPPAGISKYCFGTIFTDQNVKYNQFKSKLRYINKLTSIPA
jgi:hypothetical protein